MNTVTTLFRGMGGMLFHPGKTGQKMAAEKSLRPAALLVMGFGALYALMFFVSYLERDYPPAPDVLAVWVEHWGPGVMLPFFNIPAENYRGFQAAIMLPFALAIWMLMGGTARLLAALLGGRGSYETYLRVTGFTFFTVWLISAFLDYLFSGPFSSLVMAGLRGAYGPLVDGILTAFPPVEYTLLYGLAAVNISAAARAIEGFAWWRALIVGWAAFAWPMLLISSVVR